MISCTVEIGAVHMNRTTKATAHAQHPLSSTAEPKNRPKSGFKERIYIIMVAAQLNGEGVRHAQFQSSAT